MSNTTPTAFALRNLDAAGKPVERTRFRSAHAATMKAIELRTGSRATTRAGDGQVRQVVGLDAAGPAWTIVLGDLHVIAANRTGWVLGARI